MVNIEYEPSDIVLHQASKSKKSQPVSQVLTSRHVNVTRKRPSELSYSVSGANLRKKRRMNNGTAIICPLQNDPLIDVNITTATTREETLNYFGLSSTDKLTLDQGEILMDLRLKELNFRASEIRSLTNGDCLVSSLRDQLESGDHVMKEWSSSIQDLREKIVRMGEKLFKRGTLTFSGDPQQYGSLEDWKIEMLKEGTFADEIFLQVSSIVLSSNINIITCFRESALTNKEKGFTQIKPLQEAINEEIYLFYYSDSDFLSPHYESIHPIEQPTFLEVATINDDAPVSCEGTASVNVEATASLNVEAPVKRKRGRPRGSKNKVSKEVSKEVSTSVNETITDDSENSFNIRRKLQQYSGDTRPYAKNGPSSSTQIQTNVDVTHDIQVPIQVADSQVNTQSRVVLRFHRPTSSDDWDSVEIPQNVSSQVMITPPPPLTPLPPRPIVPIIPYPKPLSDSEEEEETSPIHPRMPPAVLCKKKKCKHQIIFGFHYDKKEYDSYYCKEQNYRKNGMEIKNPG